MIPEHLPLRLRHGRNVGDGGPRGRGDGPAVVQIHQPDVLGKGGGAAAAGLQEARRQADDVGSRSKEELGKKQRGRRMNLFAVVVLVSKMC